MSDGASFVTFGLESEPSSLKSSDYDGSSQESTSTKPYRDADSRDFWFGKKYFKCVLAQHLLPQIAASSSSSTLQVREA
jgi:hypothetical protein